MRFLSVFIFLSACICIQAYAQQEKDSTEISLGKAVETAIQNNPELKAYEYEIISLENQKIQAGLIPNPDAGFEAENFLGAKELSGIKGGEYTLSAGQTFELGGKRSSRIIAVETEIAASQGDFQVLRLRVISDVKSAFVSLVLLQQQIEKQNDFIGLNEAILKTLRERVKAGRTSPAEESKVKVTLVNSRIELERLQRKYASAQTKLSSLLGSPGIIPVPASTIFDTPPDPPDKEVFLQDTDSFPSIKNLKYEIERRKAQLLLEKSLALPDLTAKIGVRYHNELKTHSFLAGISVPIPVFNRNQGNIRSAEVRVQQMDEIIRLRRLSVISDFNASFNNLLVAHNNVLQFRETILPESENAYEITRKGYLQGRFAFIDLLDAQRTMFETQTQYLLELGDFYNSLIDIENITGKTIIK